MRLADLRWWFCRHRTTHPLWTFNDTTLSRCDKCGSLFTEETSHE